MHGARESSNRTTLFLVGFLMFVGGAYMLLNAIHVNFHFGYPYRYGGMQIASGFVMIPFMLGVGMIFYNPNNIWGWLIAGGSLVMLIFGVISNTTFNLRHMTAFELIVILVLMVGGIGLFLSSMRGGRD
jgi:hypothetical protein